MTFSKSVGLFIIFIAVGLFSYLGVSIGYYPAAIVNADVITARTLEGDLLAAYTYFKNAALVYGVDPNSLDTDASITELKRATLDKLITDKIILEELKNRINKNEFNSIAEKNINNLLEDNDTILEAAEKLYGLDVTAFKKIVLLPQAYKEILEGRMYLENEDFNKWLTEAKKDAWIVILNPNLVWQGGEVKIK